MNILLFILVLLVVVLVHEWGHFITAKKVGMRVDEFGFGFPPKLFGMRKGETEYTFNLLPIGGFVKIFGEDSEAAEGDPRAFTSRPRWAQALVLVAGVVMNVVLAWVLFSIVLMMGNQTVADVQTETSRLVITEVLEGSPAAEAGIAHGVEVLAVSSGDEEATLTPEGFRAFTETHGEALTVTYVVNGEVETVDITAADGLISGEDRQAIGVGLALIDTVRLPIHLALYEGGKMTFVALGNITVGIATLIVEAVQLEADLTNVAGPIGIVGLVGEVSSFGLAPLLMFVAFISLNLAVINLIPVPALDGGRLLFVAIEAVKQKPIPPQWVGILNTAGFALLIILMIAVTYNDILRII
ncbi:site-2 protease family protein [Candidatus Kaiserbacteria bacterium]|nr:site-2 protease family protein [Candidatus Kaiserbacteria bacterium]